MFNKIALLALSVFVVITAAPGVVSAQEAAKETDWKFGAEVYLWGASIGGKTASGRDVEVDFDDLLKDLKMGFMGAFGAHKGKWSLAVDALYLDVEDDTTVSPGIKLSADLKGWVVHPIVLYNLVEKDNFTLNILGGARYLYLSTDLGLGPLRDDVSGSFWDGIVGVRGKVNLTEKWYLPYHMDIGTGDSDVSWQALGGVGYRFKKFDVIAAYRYLDWNFDDGEAIQDLNFSGFLIGVKRAF
jgi:hypothetical protein